MARPRFGPVPERTFKPIWQNLQYQCQNQGLSQNGFLDNDAYAQMPSQSNPLGSDGGLSSALLQFEYDFLGVAPSSLTLNNTAWANRSPPATMQINAVNVTAGPMSIPATSSASWSGADGGNNAYAGLVRHVPTSQPEPLAMPQTQSPHLSELQSYRGNAFTAPPHAYEQAPSPASCRYPPTPETPFTPISIMSSHDGVSMSRTSSLITDASVAEPYKMSRRDSVASYYTTHHKFGPLQTPADVIIIDDDGNYGGVDGVGTYLMKQFMPTVSGKSGASHTGKRAQEVTQRHIINSQTKICPKPPMASSSSAAMALSQPSPLANPPPSPLSYNNDDSNNGAMAVSRPTIKRPRQPKVMCKHCNEHPDGFRGEHELRRHFASKHMAKAKRWICYDPRKNKDVTTPLRPTKEMSKCASCTKGKQYGRYDNAVAHLRRVHFSGGKRSPKAKAIRRKKTGGVDEVTEARHGRMGGVYAMTEARGGRSGGDYPPMAELSLWLCAVTGSNDNDQDGAVGNVQANDVDQEIPDNVQDAVAGAVGNVQANGAMDQDMSHSVQANSMVGQEMSGNVQADGMTCQGMMDLGMMDLGMMGLYTPDNIFPMGAPLGLNGNPGQTDPQSQTQYDWFQPL